MAETARSVVFEDVRLQMDAKIWGDEYVRHNPPKKVGRRFERGVIQRLFPLQIDIVQVCVIEFIDRNEKPLYHLEVC